MLSLITTLRNMNVIKKKKQFAFQTITTIWYIFIKSKKILSFIETLLEKRAEAAEHQVQRVGEIHLYIIR